MEVCPFNLPLSAPACCWIPFRLFKHRLSNSVSKHQSNSQVELSKPTREDLKISKRKRAKPLSECMPIRDDHYPVCRLDIWQDSEFATGYGYLKSALKREPDTDPDIRNAFIDISRIQTFGKSCTLHNHSFIIFIQKHLFSLLCHDSEPVYGVFSVS